MSTKRITVNMPSDLHMQLKLHAVGAETTINDCVLAAIAEHLKHKCNSIDIETDNSYT